MAVYVDKDLCKSCGLCIYNCPKDVFEIADEVNDKGYSTAKAVRQDNCIKCKLCEIICPDIAIYVE